MKLPSFIRINKSDFKADFQDMISTLSVSVNNIIDSIMQALNNNISLSDNIACNINDITLSVDASGTPTSTISYPITLKTKPQGISVIDINNQTNPIGYPTSGVTVSFTRQNTSIIINNVTGLIPNNKYIIRIITWA